jgi:predicted double-glycine peptidase
VSRPRWRALARGCGAVGVWLAAAGAFALAACADAPFETYLESRYEGVVGQSSDYSCGPAAVATLLQHYYGMHAPEADVLLRAEEYELAAGRELGRGISALTLKRLLQEAGIPTRGLSVTIASLVEHFATGGLPLIAHLTRPQKHYAVCVGMVGEAVVLADPSWGRQILPLTQMVTERGFEGTVLAPAPPPEVALRAGVVQCATLAWAQVQLAGLAALRERILWP